jgi:hypothetical protein
MQRAYLIGTLSVAAVLALCVVALCLAVDPYKLYPDGDDDNSGNSADLFFHLRLHKPYAIQRRAPQHLIIGSSRSARLQPHFLGEAAYNASLPGVTLREMRRMVEHAHSVRPLKTLFIGVDYYMFRQGHSDQTDHYEDHRLRRPEPSLQQRLAFAYQRLEDGWRALFSVDAVVDSATVLLDRETSQRRYRDDGTWFTEGSSRPPRWLFSALNRQKMRDFSLETDRLDATELAGLLRFCSERNIAVTVFISPFHASVMNTVRIAGKWRSYLDWQRLVSDTVAQAPGSIRLAGVEQQALVTLEPLDTPRPFYYDGVHYTDAAGELIMACLSGGPCDSESEPAVLEAGHIGRYLRRVDELMRAYPRQRPGDYAALRKWLERATGGGMDKGGTD